jgi:rRNA maturation endonuclease Nob1
MGFYGVICPNCGSPDVKRRLNMANLWRRIVYVIAPAVAFAVDYVAGGVGFAEDFGLPLKWARRCQRCGTRFKMANDDRTRPESAPVGCRECGYSLIGCTSDKCPECGSPIPHPPKRQQAER